MSIYTIEKNNHSANGLHFGVHFGIKEQKYSVRFSTECLYAPLDWENDYNKVCGWSYGMHHNNSIRVCWRPWIPEGVATEFFTPNMLEVCIYVYENGTRKISQKTLLLNVEQAYEFTLKYDTDINTIIANFPSLGNSMSIDYHTKPFIGYRLYPYFGGNKPALFKHKINVERL